MVGNSGQGVKAEEFATVADFKQIFTEDVSRLYLLSLLLTGDCDKAEECFVAGIEECTGKTRVFKEFAHSWAHRAIVQSAIRAVAPRERATLAPRKVDCRRAVENIPFLLHDEVRAILQLAPMERFVFVMSVLERYPDYDCAILLGCWRRDISIIRARAAQQLGEFLGRQDKNLTEAHREASAGDNTSGMIVDLLIAQHFAAPLQNQSLSQ